MIGCIFMVIFIMSAIISTEVILSIIEKSLDLGKFGFGILGVIL